MTRKQHVFPASAIRRFCGAQKKVRVWLKGYKTDAGNWAEFRLCGPKEQIFRADYVWDQAAETWMGEIETKYIRVVRKFDRAIGSRPEVLDPDDSLAVTDLYCLWQSRAVLRHTPEPYKPIELIGVEQDKGLTADVLRRCAELNVVTAHLKGENGFAATASRPVYGLQVQHGTHHFKLKWGSIAWACYEFPGANLIVPDECKTFPYIPFSPARCFIAVGNTPLPNVPGPVPYPGFAQIRSGSSDDPAMHASFGQNMAINEMSLNGLAKAGSRYYYFQSP